MKLVFITQEYKRVPSGVITIIRSLCEGWDSRDRITILTNRGHWAYGPLLNEFKCMERINIKRIPVWLPSEIFTKVSERLNNPWWMPIVKGIFIPVQILYSISVVIYISHWLLKNKADGVLSHNGGWPGGELNRWVMYCSMICGIKNRYMVIHNTPSVPNRLRYPLYHISNLLMGKVSKVMITVSKSCKTSLEENGGFGREMTVIYNGISVAEHQSSEVGKIKPPWNKRHTTVSFVGEIHPRKGVELLIKAIGLVDCVLELVIIGSGDPEYVQMLKNEAEKLSVPVVFLGFRSDVINLYKWIDILVLPSVKYESFGMVIIEAMRASIPVICSDYGGMKEVVMHGKTGLVVPANDKEKLSLAIKQLLANKALRISMGKEGESRLRKHFGSGSMLHQYEHLFYKSKSFK